MEKKHQRIDELNNLIKLEKNIYAEAIKNNRGFEDVKVLYLKIKKLEQEADELEQGMPVENVDYSVADEIYFLKLKETLAHCTHDYIAAIENLSFKELLNPEIFSKVASLRYRSALAANDVSTFVSQTKKKNDVTKLDALIQSKKNYYL